MKPPRLLVILALVVLAACPLVLPKYYLTLLNYIGLYSIVGFGLVLLTGVAGLTSFGQAAFVGIGAYASAVMSTKFGLSPWLGLIVGLALAGLFAAFIGSITLRLSGHYLPLSTIAWSVSLFYLFGNIEELGGHTGIDGIPALSLAGYRLDGDRSFYYLIWTAVVGSAILTVNLLDSRVGRAIKSLKNSTIMAESFGVDTARLKIQVFLYGAVLAALSGWLYAHLLRFVNPTPFGLNMSIEYLFMVVVGGASHVMGAVAGALSLTFLKQGLQDILPMAFGKSGNFENIVFGILVILLLQYAREGIAGGLSRLLPKKRIAVTAVAADALPRRPVGPGSDVILTVDSVQKRFGGLVAVNEPSFSVGKSEIVGLIGPNGAGKSTMFDLITGVQEPSAGRISLFGERIDGLPSRRIVRLGIARTFQHVQLLSTMSVVENVMIGAHLRGDKGLLACALRLDRQQEASLRLEAMTQLERVGLAELAEEPAGTIALGQQRLLEIARAMCADPQLLLLDEPAAGLRHLEKVALAALLRDLRSQGVSILIVEHDMDFVMGVVDRLVVMEFGRKISEGTPQVVQSDPRVLEAYLGSEV